MRCDLPSQTNAIQMNKYLFNSSVFLVNKMVNEIISWEKYRNFMKTAWIQVFSEADTLL